MLSFFPRGVLDEILNLIESVSEDFPSYSFRIQAKRKRTVFLNNFRESRKESVVFVLQYVISLSYKRNFTRTLRTTLVYALGEEV